MEHDSDSSHFDNDFEKVSPNDEDVVSSTAAAAAESRGGVEELHGAGSHETFEEVAAPPAPVKHESEGVMELGQPQQSPKGPSVCPARTTEKSSECCTSCCMMMQNVDPRVIDLLMWRDIKKTGIVFASVIIVLLSLSLFSVLSVVAYFGLVVLTIATSFRLYSNVMCMMNKSTDGGAPFKKCLECDLTIPEETVHRYADLTAQHLSKFAEHLRRLFLVENVVDSLKFGLVLWLLTYVGGWFNGMTLLLIAAVDLFTLPKIYSTYKVQIDHYAHLGCSKISDVWKKVEDKLPMWAKKKQA